MSEFSPEKLAGIAELIESSKELQAARIAVNDPALKIKQFASARRRLDEAFIRHSVALKPYGDAS